MSPARSSILMFQPSCAKASFIAFCCWGKTSEAWVMITRPTVLFLRPVAECEPVGGFNGATVDAAAGVLAEDDAADETLLLALVPLLVLPHPAAAAATTVATASA